VLWFHPKVVDRTGVTTAAISPTALSPLHAGVQESSLAAARAYVDNLTTTTTTATTTTTSTAPARQHQTTPAPSTTTTAATVPTGAGNAP